MAIASLALCVAANAFARDSFVVVKCTVQATTFPPPAPAVGAAFFRRVGNNYFAAWSDDGKVWGENKCPSRTCATYPEYYDIAWSSDGTARWTEKLNAWERADAEGRVRAYRYFEGAIATHLKIDRSSGELTAVQTVEVGRDEGLLDEKSGVFDSTGGFTPHILTRTYEEHDHCERTEDPQRLLPPPKF